MMELLPYVLLGVLGGIMSGLLGIGGAIVLVPALVYFFSFDQHMAQGTTTALMLPPIGIMAFMQYYKHGYVDVKVAALICMGMIVGSYFGGYFATHLPANVLKKVFGVLLFLVSIRMVFFSK